MAVGDSVLSIIAFWFLPLLIILLTSALLFFFLVGSDEPPIRSFHPPNRVLGASFFRLCSAPPYLTHFFLSTYSSLPFLKPGVSCYIDP